MRRTALVAVAALLAACATTEKARESWAGASYDEVVRTWGPPASSTKLADGSDVHTWVSQAGPTYRPGPTVGFGIGGFGIGGGSGNVGVGVGASVPVGQGSASPPTSCQRTLTFRDGQLVGQNWIGPDEVCSVFARAR